MTAAGAGRRFGPALLLMLALSVLPLVNLFWMSFYNVTWSGGQATWTPVGLDHYRRCSGRQAVPGRRVQHLVFAIAAVAGQMVLGFVAGLLCSRDQPRPGDLSGRSSSCRS